MQEKATTGVTMMSEEEYVNAKLEEHPSIQQLTFIADDRWIASLIEEPTLKDIGDKLVQALTSNDFQRFQEIVDRLSEFEVLYLGDEFFRDWFAECTNVQQYKFVIKFFSTQSALFMPHDNDIIIRVLRSQVLDDSDKKIIVEQLLDDLDAPVILDDEFEKTMREAGENILPTELHEKMCRVGSQYRFAHQLETAYMFRDKERFQRLVESQDGGLANLPSRYPRFVSREIGEFIGDWIDFLLKWEKISVCDYYEAFVQCQTSMGLRVKLHELLPEDDDSIAMIVRHQPRESSKWNELKLNLLKDFTWRTRMITEINKGESPDWIPFNGESPDGDDDDDDCTDGEDED